MVRCAVVTGSTRGIGQGIGLKLLSAGYAVVFNGRGSEEAFNERIEQLGHRRSDIHYVKGELPDTGVVDELIGSAMDRFGNVSVLVNNVGSVVSADGWAEASAATIRQTLDVNFLSAVVCTQAVLPLMRQQKWGRIVNIASIYSANPAGPVAFYGAAKSALVSFTRSIAVELAPVGITANCVSPGNVDTDMTRRAGESYISEVVARTPARRLGRVEEIAELVLFLASSEFIVGQDIAIDGGISLLGG